MKSKYTPFEPVYKITFADCGLVELLRMKRVIRAVIGGLLMRRLTLAEVHQVFTMPDDKAAMRLALTVTSLGGFYTDHDLMGPQTYLVATLINDSKAGTVAALKAFRDQIEARILELS